MSPSSRVPTGRTMFQTEAANVSLSADHDPYCSASILACRISPTALWIPRQESILADSTRCTRPSQLAMQVHERNASSDRLPRHCGRMLHDMQVLQGGISSKFTQCLSVRFTHSLTYSCKVIEPRHDRGWFYILLFQHPIEPSDSSPTCIGIADSHGLPRIVLAHNGWACMQLVDIRLRGFETNLKRTLRWSAKRRLHE